MATPKPSRRRRLAAVASAVAARPRLAAALALGWAALTWVLLASPPPPPEEVPGWLPVWLAFAVPGSDKAGHAGLFFVQAMLLHAAFRAGARPRRGVPATLALCALLGLATELRQLSVPGRSAEALDLLADVAGAASWVAVWALSSRLAAASPGAASGRSAAAPRPASRRP